MRYKYSKYVPNLLDELDMDELMSKLSDLLLSSGFGNPWGDPNDGQDRTMQALHDAILEALFSGGVLPPDLVERLFGDQADGQEESLQQQLQELIEQIIEPSLPEHLRQKNIKYHVNPTGRFVIGGPQGDAGLTGRKIIVDTYGGMGRHGGGAFSGKDPSKVDRSASYAARWVAKNVVASGLARRCEVQVAYAIGVAEPVSVMVDAFDTSTVPESAIMSAVRDVFDLTPRGIIQALDLRKPIYSATSAYGHFGRTPRKAGSGRKDGTLFTWERTDRAKALARAAHRVTGDE